MNPLDVLKLYKSQAAMARAFEVTPAAIIKWLRTASHPYGSIRPRYYWERRIRLPQSLFKQFIGVAPLVTAL